MVWVGVDRNQRIGVDDSGPGVHGPYGISASNDGAHELSLELRTAPASVWVNASGVASSPGQIRDLVYGSDIGNIVRLVDERPGEGARQASGATDELRR